MTAKLFVLGCETVGDPEEFGLMGDALLSVLIGGEKLSAAGFNQNWAQAPRAQPAPANA